MCVCVPHLSVSVLLCKRRFLRRFLLLRAFCAAASTSLAQGCHPAVGLSMLQQACPV